MAEKGDFIPGTLDMLILKVLQLEPMHGWGITERIEQRSDTVLRVNTGSLYPSLYRLLRKGWIKSEWRQTENNRRARYYIMTARGRAQLAAEREQWHRLSRAVDLILDMTS
jgi:PadR family transcriptional regulator PadR